jgi:hypothetical protein
MEMSLHRSGPAPDPARRAEAPAGAVAARDPATFVPLARMTAARDESPPLAPLAVTALEVVPAPTAAAVALAVTPVGTRPALAGVGDTGAFACAGAEAGAAGVPTSAAGGAWRGRALSPVTS